MAHVMKKAVIAAILYLCITPGSASKLPATGILQRIPRRSGPRDYGPLGNLLKWLIDRAYGQVQDSTTPGAPVSNQTDPGKPFLTDAETHTQILPESKPRRKPNYGPLGNAIVQLLEQSLGPRKRGAAVKVGVKGAARPETNDALQPDAAAKPTARKPNRALQSVRELVKLLGSNFLQDPSFARAAEALKLRDRQLLLDAGPGSGEFITATQKELLVSRAQDCAVCSAV